MGSNPVFEFVQREPFIAIVLILMSLVAIFFIVERIMAFNKFGVVNSGELNEVLDLVKAGRDNEALRAVNDRPGPAAAVARVILSNAKRPVAEVERLVQEAAEEFFLSLEKFLPVLDTITTLSPLWGLFGTIVGMIQVFVQYAKATDDSTKQNILPNVGTALYATAAGILIASVHRRDRAGSDQVDQRSRSTGHVCPLGLGFIMRLGKNREMKHTKIEIIPMIDTMFFLLVFFVLASLNIIDLRGLNLDLPPASGKKQKTDPKTLKEVKLEIAIEKDGTKVINGKTRVAANKSASVDLIAAVDTQLQGKRKDPAYRATRQDLKELTVLITPAPDAFYEYVIHAVDDSRGAYIEKFNIR
jgi:biopolymer transport protein ExbB/TolQ/biopolymer transport protein ExbD